MDTFLYKLALSFIAGGLFTIIITVLSEKYGTKIGGLIAGLPSTSLVALFFIGWTQGVQTASDATTVMPLMAGVNCIFALCYIFLLKKGFVISLLGSFMVWSICAFVVVFTGFNDFVFSLVVWAVLFTISSLLSTKVRFMEGKKTNYSSSILLGRAFLGASVITISVVLSRSGAILSGMFAMFPAMFTSTLIITHSKHGPIFSSGVMKSAIIGSVSVVIYAVSVRYSYPSYGLMFGTILSIIVSFGSAYIIYKYLIIRLD